jgi:hypothetical protein
MSAMLFFRLRRRRAVSTLIGGVIVLSLLLTALGTMVFVTQQYDQYEQTVNRVAQYRNQQVSEDLVAISPGLAVVNSTISGWGSGCDGSGVNKYNCYDATISNLGTVGVQITRIYVNSTGIAGSGCSSPNPTPCILNPTSTIGPYAFEEATEFLNPGEANHTVMMALPIGVGLPDPTTGSTSGSTGGFPENSIVIVTSRGNLFSFQWPFQVSVFGQSQSAFSTGNMKVAYTGTFDSAKEIAAGGSGGTGYCHTESSEPYPAGPGYAEKLTGVTGYGDSGVLWFLNPWITGGNSQAIMNSVETGVTTLYIYVVVINTGTTSYNPTAGTIDLTWYGSNHIDGPLIGVYYNGNFATSPSIAPGSYYYAIFEIKQSSKAVGVFTIGNPPPQDGQNSVMFWGAASITNALGSSAEGNTFFSGSILVSGLWIRYEGPPATAGSCA